MPVHTCNSHKIILLFLAAHCKLVGTVTALPTDKYCKCTSDIFLAVHILVH